MPNILWTDPHQPSGQIIRAVAAFGGIPLELPTYKHDVSNKTSEFLAKFPHGKIPAFEGADGFKLFEGLSIARYLASLSPNSGLLGKSQQDAALVDQWLHLSESEVETNSSLIFQLLNKMISPYNKSTHDTFVERAARALRTLNRHLEERTYFVGENLTLADIVIAYVVRIAATVYLDAPLRTEMPHLIRHAEDIASRPQLNGLWEKVKYIEKASDYVPKFHGH